MSEQAGKIRQMFEQISPRYNLLNKLMTAGQDIRLRLEAIRRLGVIDGLRIIDIGCGTGDIALQIVQKYKNVQVVACDFTPGMLYVARQRKTSDKVAWVIADAMALPFVDDTFDRAISGFLLRNAMDTRLALSEQFRILRSDGIVVSLDTTPPGSGLLKPLIRVYLHFSGDVFVGVVLGTS